MLCIINNWKRWNKVSRERLLGSNSPEANLELNNLHKRPIKEISTGETLKD